MIDDAEMILGMGRHLSTYSVSASTAALGNLGFAGKVYEMAWRLRGSSLSSAERVRAIGVHAHISNFELDRMVLPTLETLNWIKINRTADGGLYSVEAVVPPPTELVAAAPQILNVCGLDALQLAVMKILRATTLQPLEHDAALEAAAECGEETAEAALRHLVALNLVKEVRASDGRHRGVQPEHLVG